MLYIELREILHLVLSIQMICVTNLLTTVLNAVSSHGCKWIDVKLLLHEFLAMFHTVVLTIPNLCTLASVCLSVCLSVFLSVYLSSVSG